MKIWSRFPFVRLLLPLITGILLVRGFPVFTVNPLWVAMAVALLILLWLLSVHYTYRYRHIFGILLNLFLVLLGVLLTVSHQQQSSRLHFSRVSSHEETVFRAVLVEPPEARKNSMKLVLEIDRITVGGKVSETSGRILAYARRDSLSESLAWGDVLLFSQKPEPVKGPANPGEFNFARYLATKNVFHQVYLGSGNFMITGRHQGSFLRKTALAARERLLGAMRSSGIEGKEFAVIAALLIGYDDLLDAAQRQEYSGAGVVHILCVSGLHVGVIFLIADYLFFFLRKKKKFVWLRAGLIIAVIWAFALITGLAPSVMRAALMFSLITIGKSLNRQSHTYNTLAASAFLLLVMNPAMLYDLGFQLSYLAVIGIVTFQPLIKNLYIPGNKAAKYVWELVCVSLAAQIATVPISLFYFHQFPNYFLIANLIAIPLSGVLIYTGVVFVFFSFIPLIADVLAVTLVWQVRLLNASVSFIDKLPGAVARNLYLTPEATIMLYVMILLLLLWYSSKEKRYIYPFLLLVLMLTADAALVAIGRMNQRMLVVYSLNRHTAVGFINGRSEVILADSSICSDPQKLAYSTDGFRIRSGIRDIELISLQPQGAAVPSAISGLKMKEGYFSFLGRRGVVLRPGYELPQDGRTLRLDYAILTGNMKGRLRQLQVSFPGAVFIADASNSRGRIGQWQEEAETSGVKFYSVRDSGAWMELFP